MKTIMVFSELKLCGVYQLHYINCPLKYIVENK
jgi:hypothetical protein